MKRVLSKLVTLTVAALLFMSLAGPAAAKTIKIGFILKTMQEERYQRDKAAFIAKA